MSKAKSVEENGSALKRTVKLTIEVPADIYVRLNFEQAHSLETGIEVYLRYAAWKLPRPYFRIVPRAGVYGLHFRHQACALDTFATVSEAFDVGRRLLRQMGGDSSDIHMDPLDLRYRRPLEKYSQDWDGSASNCLQ